MGSIQRPTAQPLFPARSTFLMQHILQVLDLWHDMLIGLHTSCCAVLQRSG